MSSYTHYFTHQKHTSEAPLDAFLPWIDAEIGGQLGQATAVEYESGEFWLWRAVIAQALQDCATVANGKKARSARAEAIAWLSLYNEDFLWVCGLAGLDPNRIVKRAKLVIKESESTRKRPLETYVNKTRWKWFNQQHQRKSTSLNERSKQK